MTFLLDSLTCLSEVMSSWLLAVATRALLQDGLSCNCSDSPDTKCSRSAVTLTCCSRTRTRTWARTWDEKGDSTCTQDTVTQLVSRRGNEGHVAIHVMQVRLVDPDAK